MTFLKAGLIKRHIDENIYEEKYIMRLLEANELENVVKLQNYVYSQLPNKQVLYMDSYQEMLDDMKSGAKIIGVYNEQNNLIAYRYIGFPGENDKNLGNDISLPKQEFNKVVHLETTVVHPEYRGNSLQSLTLQQVVPLVKAIGYKHLLCTVSPQNFYSLFNVMRNGLKIKALKRKYGTEADGKDGLWRFILHRDIDVTAFQNPIKLFSTHLSNIEEQKKLIDESYVGFWLFKDSKMLSYVKFDEYAAAL